MVKEKTQDDVDFLKIAHERFRRIDFADGHNRETALSSLRFVYNIDEGQWSQDIRDEREEDGRPYLTSNKLRKFVAQVANRERDQRLAGNVKPVDDKGDVQRAEIISGLIRQIEKDSNAEKIYTDAGEHAIAAGFGYWRITTEELDDSMEQEVFIREIKNQFSVYLDPEGMYGFIKEKLTADEFEYQYPDANKENFESGQTGEYYNDWYDSDSVYIAEYFYKERVNTEIVQAVNELSQEEGIFELSDKVTSEKLESSGWIIQKTKRVKAFKVKWKKITGSQILEEGEWVGKEIPIIEVQGDWVNIDGKVYKRSLVADALDDQRMYNYWKTTTTETVAMAPKSPWLVQVNAIKGNESFWESAHKKLLPYLPWKGKERPTREAPPQIPTGAAAMLDLCQRDIQDTIGMYDSSFGERSNERTGVAIRQRASRSDFGTLHYQDNFRRAVLKTIREHLLDIIPKVYDTKRIIRILGEDSSDQQQASTLVTINEELPDGTIFNDLTVGKYDYIADTKVMSTRRQEMLEGMSSVMQASPNISPLLVGEFAKAQDWPGAQRIAAKIEKFLPALLGIQPQEGGEENPSGGDSQSGGLL